MRKNVLIILGLVIFIASAQVSRADSIALESRVGGVYTYGFRLTSSSSVFFGKGQTITLSGLSGVTGASTGSMFALGNFAVQSFNSTSVVFVQAGPYGGTTYYPPSDLESLVVDSSVLTLGPVSYTFMDSSATGSGSVEGPAAPAPEPSSFTLLGLVILLGLGAALTKGFGHFQTFQPR